MIPQRGSRRLLSVINISIGFVFFLSPVFLLATPVLAQERTGAVQSSSAIDIADSSSSTFKSATTFSPKLIRVFLENEEREGITYGITVEDALTDLEIDYSDDCEILPDLTFELTKVTHIFINKIEKERNVEIESIPYSSITITDNNREIDTTTVVQSGRNGEKRVVYEYSYRDGILIDKTAIREETIQKPQNEIVALGTKRIFRKMTINGDTFKYWKKITVYATSYDSSCAGCSNTTALGAKLQKGVVAVDPTVIPLRTKMYVPGYGFGQALDVGGGVKGNMIDLGFEDLSKVQGQWSARYVEIYILD